MNYSDSGRPGEFAIDHHQAFHNVGRDAKHRDLEIAMLGGQSKQVVQAEADYGCRLEGLDVEMRSTGQQYGKQPHHRPTSKDVGMDLLAKSIKQRSFESSGDNEVDLIDL